MINQTTNVTSEILKITFEDWTALTLKPEFIVVMLAIWLIPILAYIIIGALVKSGGQYYSKRMIEYPNFFYAIIIWFFIQGALILCLALFPLWIKFLN